MMAGTPLVLLVLATHFINVTGPNGQSIDIAIDQIVSLRDKRADEEHFHSDVKCLVHTADGKFIGVKESCKEVEERLNAAYHKREEQEP